jgi:nuclear pore complex protein Nup98-Nup96
MFNATKPATGFGAFGGGGTSAFGGSGGTFGPTTSSQPNPSLFSQPAATSSAFGTSSFGNKPATSAFGGATSCMSHRDIFTPSLMSDCSHIANPNAGSYDGVPPVTTGTANPAYSVFSEKDSANTSMTLQYQSITCMPQYRGNSFEVSIRQASLSELADALFLGVTPAGLSAESKNRWL